MIDPKTIDLASLPWLPLSERSAFPRQPAIYFAIDSEGIVQYVGISKDPKQRWVQHHRYEQLQSAGGVRIAYLFVEDIALLRPIEAALIAWFHPPLNVVGAPDRCLRTGGKYASGADIALDKQDAFALPEEYIASLKWGKELGKRLRHLRGSIPLRKLELKTTKSGSTVSFRYIQQLERPEPSLKRLKNDYLTVSIDVVRVLCAALDVELSVLLEP